MSDTERLQAQLDAAHAILGSEPMMWMTVGNSADTEKYRARLEPAIIEYWDMYGNAHRGPISSRELAMIRMVRLSEELGLYD